MSASSGGANAKSTIDRKVVPEAGPLRAFEFPPINRFTLANGLPVLFCRTEGLPVVTFSLLLPGGAFCENPAQAGLASLTSALLESGAAGMDAAAIAERIETLGARLGSRTGWEVSRVDFTVLADRADDTAVVAAALVREPSFPAGEVERLRQEQLARILQRRAEPRALADEMADRFIFAPDTPFSRPLSGTTATVAGLERPDVESFHRRTFTPREGALIVAGNLPESNLREIAQRAFGEWTGPEPARPVVEVRPRTEHRQVVVVDRPGAVQSEVRIGHLGPSRKTPDYFELLVMNTILGGAFSSRLNLNLRERHGYTYGVKSGFAMGRHPGHFLVSTAVQTEVTSQAVQEILHELGGILDDTVTQDELADARQYVAGTFPLRLQATEGVASRLAELFIYGLPDSYLQEFSDRITGVSRNEVIAAARRHVHPEIATILVVGDGEKVAAQLEEAQLGPVRVVGQDELD